MTPRVSVIMPTYKRASTYLPQAIESVLAQTFQDWELLVVDDASPDHTAAVVEAYRARDARVYYLRGAGQGPGAARKLACSQARGMYLAFLDDDDMWMPRKLATQLAQLERDPALGLVYAKAIVIDKEGIPRSVKPSGPPAAAFQDLIERNSIPLSSVVMRRTCYEAVGGFDGRLSPCEDLFLWLRVSRLYPFTYCEEAMVRYRWHGANLSTRAASKRLEMTIRVFERMTQLSLTAADRVRIERRLVQLHYLYGRVLMFEGRLPDARRHLATWLRSSRAGSLPRYVRVAVLWALTWAHDGLLRPLRQRWQTREPRLFFGSNPAAGRQ